MEKMVISSTVMIRSCNGLVLPRTAPKEIRTVAVLKSALMILQDNERKSEVGKWRAHHIHVNQGDTKTQETAEKTFVLEDVDADLSVIIRVPEALHEEAPLQPEGSQQQVDAHTAEPISLEECHEEPEADEDHDMDILKH